MKKRLAMMVTMLIITVSMAACGGKKDTTADKETVINTEATEAVAETEEPATEELEAATETEEPETEAVAEQETTGKLESNTASTTATTAQTSDNNTNKSNKSSNSGSKAVVTLRAVQAALHQPEQRPVMPVEQLEAVITPILLTIMQLRHMNISGCCMKAAVIMRHR